MSTLLGQCLQAVLYFRRALKLDKNYLSAWTLMGHEYVEMKNPAAAIGTLAVAGQQLLQQHVCRRCPIGQCMQMA